MPRTSRTVTSRAAIPGKRGRAVHPDQALLGWQGVIAHPNAPVGGGGPGGFRQPGSEQGDLGVGDPPDPWRPGPSQPSPLDGAKVPTPAKAPPPTNPRSLGTLKSAQSDLLDVEVDAVVAADGSGGSSDGETTFTTPAATAPSYSTSGNKIVSFDAKFTWRGTVTIQTVYTQGTNSTDVSCYGRGTTDADVRDRNITLGFHESCHRDDYAAYLKAHALPDPPALSVGMTEAAFKSAVADFNKAFRTYFNDMKADSTAKTDEVGFTRSKALRTNTCYVHVVP